MGSSINVALPAIGKDLSMHAVVLGWVATAYLLASAMLLVPFGRLADIYGRKKLFTIGMVIYTAGSLVATLSNSSAMLIATRVVQGIGGSMIFSSGTAILTSAFPA
ncbi:MAG: MFS transporter, partial [Chloroflexi bacterium]|nr:MFS transporter [Chloroflexota bacterium]MBM4452886.1 MFS transporter [Chloroflexota bacterium]